MWMKNKETGVVFNITDEVVLARLKRSPDYEVVEAPVQEEPKEKDVEEPKNRGSQGRKGNKSSGQENESEHQKSHSEDGSESGQVTND
jgi:hypothetical protein